MYLAPTKDEIASFIPLGNLKNLSARVLRDSKTSSEDDTTTEKKKKEEEEAKQEKQKSKKGQEKSQKAKNWTIKKIKKTKIFTENEFKTDWLHFR